MIVCSLWMAPTFGLPWAIPNLFGVTNLKIVGWGMRWVYASKQGIFAGGMGRTSPRFGMMEWFSKTLWCRCWNMVRGVRQMEGIGVVHLSSLNVPNEFGERVESRRWQKVRSRQETVNERLKNWGILATPYRHNFKLHQTVFAAVIVLLQLSFEYNSLFSVEYWLDFDCYSCEYFSRSC